MENIINNSGTMKAGVGKYEIILKHEIFPIEGFTYGHDPIYVRILYLLNDPQEMVIAVVDATSLQLDYVLRFKTIIAKILKVQMEAIWICANHSFNIPHLIPEERLKTKEEKKKGYDLISAYDTAVKKSAQIALENLQTARLSYLTTKSCVNINRNQWTKEGWWLGSNEDGPSDKKVSIIKIEDSMGKIVAIWSNYAVQSSVMHKSIGDNGQVGVTGDLLGRTATTIEAFYEDAMVALFTIGTAGDQAPVLTAKRLILDQLGNYHYEDNSEQGWFLLTLLSERLAQTIIEALRTKLVQSQLRLIQYKKKDCLCDGQEIPENTQAIQPVLTYEFKKVGEESVPYEVIDFGDLAIVGVQVELTAKALELIERESHYENIMVVTMVNGGAKYMAEEEAYKQLHYSAINSKYAKGSAEVLCYSIAETLKTL